MKTSFLIFSLFLCQLVFSQSDYRKGYIVNKDNDTIKGFINYTIGSNKFEKVSFKVNLNSKETIYLPNTIQGYGIGESEYFQSRYIKDEKYENSFFIENLVLGKINLHKLYNQYFIEKDTLFLRLDNDDRKVIVKGKEYYSRNKRYTGILKYLTADCKKTKQWGKISYSESSLVEFINTYNTCNGGDVTVFKNNKPWFKANLGVFVGYNLSTITNKRDQSGITYFENSNSSKRFVSFGAFMELGSPRIVERISFFTGIVYNSFEYYEYEKSGTNLYELNVTVKQLNIPLALRYTFPERKTTPYITFGVLTSINIENENNWSYENNTGSQVYTSLENFNTPVNSFGLTGGIGFKRKVSKRLEGFVDVNYQYLDSSRYFDMGVNSYQTNISSIQILLGIRL